MIAHALSVDQNDAGNEQINVVKNYDDAYKAYVTIVKEKEKALNVMYRKLGH